MILPNSKISKHRPNTKHRPQQNIVQKQGKFRFLCFQDTLCLPDPDASIEFDSIVARNLRNFANKKILPRNTKVSSCDCAATLNSGWCFILCQIHEPKPNRTEFIGGGSLGSVPSMKKNTHLSSVLEEIPYF